MSELHVPAIDTVAIDAVLAALADPIRLTLVRALIAAEDWTCGSDVLRSTGITIGRSTLSHHLKVLREAGLIQTRVQGTRRLVALRHDDLTRRFPGLLELVAPPAAAPTEPGTSTPTA